MKTVILLTVGLIPVFAGIGVFYNPISAGVANRVVNIDRSFDSSRSVANCLVLGEWSDVLTNHQADLKVSGTNVVVLTQADRDAIAAAQAAEELAKQQFEERRAKTNAYVELEAFLKTPQGRIIRAQLELLIDEVNTLRAEQPFLRHELNKIKMNGINAWRAEPNLATNGWPNRTIGQARTGIINKLDAQPQNQ